MWLALTGLILLLAACSQDAATDGGAPDADPVASMTDLELLEYLGYDPQDATEYELYYTVGDEIVSKERLDEIRREPQTRMQYLWNNLLDVEHQTIYLTDEIIFKQQLRDAVEEWNKLYADKKSNIRFEFDNRNPNSVLIMDTNCSLEHELKLYVERPRNGAYGKMIKLDISNSLSFDLAFSDQIKYLYMHALGHLIGLEHALDYGDPFPDDEGTVGTACDPYSIMMDETNLLADKNFYRGFTNEDKDAINKLYPYKTPAPDPEPDVPEFKITCTPAPTGKSGTTLKLDTDYEIQAVYTYSKCPAPKYKFTITSPNGSSADYSRTDLGNGKIRLRFAKTGLYKVTATVTNATEENTKTVTYNLPDPRPVITGPSKAELGKFYDFSVTYQNADYPNPTFDLWWDEMVFDTGYATVQRVSANRFRVRFDEPGGFRILADVQGATGIESGETCTSAYYRPYWKVEKKSKRLSGIEFPVKVKPSTAIDWNKRNVVDEFTNTLYFYADEACTQQIPLAHDIVFDYYIYYDRKEGDRYSMVGSFDPAGHMIARKGQKSVTLPETQKTRTGGALITTVTMDPYYDIRYPEN